MDKILSEFTQKSQIYDKSISRKHILKLRRYYDFKDNPFPNYCLIYYYQKYLSFSDISHKLFHLSNIIQEIHQTLQTITMNIACQHISSNCNPIPNAFDFLTQTLIAYCYKNQVGLYDLNQKQVYRNIHPQKLPYPNRANSIKTFSKNGKYHLIVGYDNGDLILYGSTDLQEWVEQQSIKQKNGIISVSLHHDFAAVNNNDALVTVYKIQTENDKIKLTTVQQIQFPLNKTVQTIALYQFEGFLVIFLGGVDQMVHCYSLNLSTQDSQLSYYFSLTGHESAITKLTIDEDDGRLQLASASKDGYIRLWRVTKNRDEAKFHKNVKTLKLSPSLQFAVFLDSVLISHECSVTNLHWAKFNNTRKLLSSSLDCTICIWAQTEDSSWSVESRMGQFLGNKNAYFQVISNKSGSQLAALNYIGSVLIWNYEKQSNKFTLRESFNGHYNEVKDIAWNYSGDFLVSVSKDQTTRVLAQHHETKKYHEISRAQIHGYDINTVCLLKTKDQTFDIIACGADEKVIRLFEPPACFANYFNSFTHKNFHLFFNSLEEEEKYLLKRQSQDSPLLYETYTEGGAQVLGLMTKMQRVERQKVVNYYNEEDEEAEDAQEQKVDLKETKKIDFSIPPHDDYLVKHTLWPEMNKLYGHPHELQYVCKSHDSKLMASSCKSLNREDSSIIIWNTETWKIHKILTHHAYTVYSMQFSASGKYFTSVSKDRKLAVFDSSFELIFSYEAHSRAITSVSVSSNEKYIVTGSRDKTIKIHSIEDKKPIAQHEFKSVITAVAFCQLQGKEGLICCGFIDGGIVLVEWSEKQGFKLRGQVQHKYGHTEKINGIRWNREKFATCSDDHSVAVFKVKDL